MKNLCTLIRRNIAVFLNDKSNIFYSLMAMIIIIGLNATFLNKTNVDSLIRQAGADSKAAGILVNAMILSGIIVVNAITVTLGVAGIKVEDEESGRLKAFYVSPAGKAEITMGYILASFMIGCVFCFITFLIVEVYICLSGGEILAFNDFLKVSLYIIINVFSSAAFVFFIVSCIHTGHALSSVTVLAGTLVGFMGGIYIPLGSLPHVIQKVMKCTPIIYGTSLLKEIFVKKSITDVFGSSNSQAVKQYKEYMAISLTWHHDTVSELMKVGVLLLSGIFFGILSMIVIQTKKVKDR